MGPFNRATIQQKLRAGEISQLHEIKVGERWVTVRAFLSETPAATPPPPPPPEQEMDKEEPEPEPEPAEPFVPQEEERPRLRFRRDAAPDLPPAPPPMPPPPVVPFPTAPTMFTGTQYAGFWRRAAAALLDGLLLGAVWLVLGGITMLLMLVPLLGFAAMIVMPLIGLAAGWLYYALLESSARQATLGKRAVGIVVSDLNGRRVSFGRATGRFFGKTVSSILMAGYIMAAFTEKKQGLHDMMAGTVVTIKQ
jgi:uncharacterized RDD family membrane protein YckC